MGVRPHRGSLRGPIRECELHPKGSGEPLKGFEKVSDMIQLEFLREHCGMENRLGRGKPGDRETSS